MGIEQKIWIFYYWPIFECVQFFIPQSLTASLKLLKCNNNTFCFFSLVSGVTYTCWPLRQQGRNKGSLASKKKGDAVRWLARQRCCRRGRRVAARSDGSTVAPLGIQIDGFPNATLISKSQLPAHFLLKCGYI